MLVCEISGPYLLQSKAYSDPPTRLIESKTGDFVLLANEVNPVVRMLEGNGISVTAIHNHMLMETPRLFYLHFWAVGQPEGLASVLKRTLEQTNSILK